MGLLIGSLVGCRGVAPSGVEHPAPALDGCVPIGTRMIVRLHRPLDTADTQPGEAVTAWVINPVRGANGVTSIPPRSNVWGQVDDVQRGPFPRVVLGFNRVETSNEPSSIRGFLSEPPVQYLGNGEGRVSAEATMAVLLDEPQSPERSIVCAQFARVPSGTSIHVRLDELIDSSVARPGESIRAVLLEPVIDTRGQPIAQVGATLDLQISSVETGARPSLRLRSRRLQTLLGTVAIVATAQSGFEPYAAVQPVAPADPERSAGEFRVRPISPPVSTTSESSPNAEPGTAPVDRARPIRIPAGAELLVTLVEPLLVPLPRE
jgi:hypothetical protein